MVQTLSVCTIVKNEENQLPGMLDSISGIADEIIVVDTGSTDQTVKIAEQYGANVFCYTWNNNFSEARNFASKQAKKDWIFIIDADERLIYPENLKKYLIPATDILYMLKVIHLSNKTDSYINAGCHSNSRLFPNNQNFEYTGLVHEHIIRKENLPYRRILIPECEINHYGFILTQDERSNKNKRNINLLESEISQREKDSYYYYLHYLLGTEYLSLREFTKATEYLKKCLEYDAFDENIIINTATSLIKIFSIIGDWDNFKIYSEKYLSLCQISPDFCLIYGIALNEVFNYKEQSRYFFLKALNFNPEKFPYIIYDNASITWKPLFLTGEYYFSINNFYKSRECFEKALKFTENFWQIQYNLILNYLKLNEYESAKNMFDNSKKLFPEDEMNILKNYFR